MAGRWDECIDVGLAKWPSFSGDMTDNSQEGDSTSDELLFQQAAEKVRDYQKRLSYQRSLPRSS
jgi:hypothetical protein